MYSVNEIILLSSILLPAITGLVCYRRINPVYFPFLLLMWLGLLNEVVSLTVISLGFYNYYNFNLFHLVETLLIIWQFKNLRLFEHRTFFILSLSTIGWFITEAAISGLNAFYSYFYIYCAVLIVFLSMHMINKLLVTERSNLFKNAVFLFCCAFIIFFTASIVTEVFWLYGTQLSKEFRSGMQAIFGWSNCICNIIYAFAILWMPRKLAFTLTY
ncbi:hypothetical protein [Pseudocnuella soli]|uniref:hypothetical protein n=1 Tax=Pseudocnuella soli TaxID=2502779 RepID=UPI0010490949|nr:hypothetical protein [Pseudocnuella soli]